MIDPVQQNKTFNALEDQQMKWLPHHVIKEEKSPLVIISTISMRDIQETLWPCPVSTNQILWQFPQKTNWGEIQILKTSHHQWTIKLSVKFYPRYGRKCWDSPWKFWGNKIDCLKQFSQKVSCWNCFLHLQCQSWGKKMEILGAKLETNLNQFSSLQCKIVTIEPSKCLSTLLPPQLRISICFVWNIANLQHSVEKYPKQVAKFFISCFEHLQFLCSCSFLSNHFISDLICWLGPKHHTPFQFNGQPCIEVMLGNVSHKTSGENLWPHLDLVSTKKVSQSPFF